MQIIKLIKDLTMDLAISFKFTVASLHAEEKKVMKKWKIIYKNSCFCEFLALKFGFLVCFFRI
jgi:hypothetical protein